MRIIVTVLVGVLGGCSGERVCNVEGCDATATIDLITNTPASALANATLTVCVGDRCSSAVVPELSPTRNAMSLDGPLWGYARIYTEENGAIISALVHLNTGVPHRDGDVYSASLAVGGTVLASVEQTASSYRVEYPNGEDCPPACPIAELLP